MTREEAIKAIKSHCYFANLVPVGKEALDMAIKALEPEPCEDCISRAELLKAVDTWDKFGCDADSKLVPYKDCYVPYIHYDDVVKAIKGMPSVQPKTEWIPVSERLPEELKGVLVYCPTNDNIFCAYLEKGVWKIFSPIALEDVKEIVTAWMPLPEPYKAESEE